MGDPPGPRILRPLRDREQGNGISPGAMGEKLAVEVAWFFEFSDQFLNEATKRWTFVVDPPAVAAHTSTAADPDGEGDGGPG